MGCVNGKDAKCPPEHHIVRDEPLLFKKKILKLKLDVSGSHRPFPYLFVALHHRQARMLHVMLAMGADANLPVKATGDTPLHMACRLPPAECEPFVVGLISGGAKVNTQNIGGLAPLHMAVEEGNLVAAKVLLRYGADVHIQDRTGRSPLDLCRSDEMRRVLDPYRNARSVDTISPYYTPGGTLKTSAEPQPSSDMRVLAITEAVNSTPEDDWIPRIPKNEIELGKSLGVGAFAQVFYGVWRSTPVAVKKLFFSHTDDDEAYAKAFIAELKALRSVKNHPNIVLLMGLVEEPQFLAIVMEYLSRGSVYDMLHKQKMKFSLEMAINMARDVARGMAFLHSAKPPIIHRDLKTPNLLVTDSFQVKISDFGLTRKTEGTMVQTAAGTPAWMAPEVLREEAYSIRADVYSFGIVLWELVTGKVPHPKLHYYELLKKVADEGLRPEIPPGLPPALESLIRDCWAEDSHARPLFPEILRRLDVIKSSLRAPVVPGGVDPIQGAANGTTAPSPRKPSPVPSPTPALLEYLPPAPAVDHTAAAAAVVEASVNSPPPPPPPPPESETISAHA